MWRSASRIWRERILVLQLLNFPPTGSFLASLSAPVAVITPRSCLFNSCNVSTSSTILHVAIIYSNSSPNWKGRPYERYFLDNNQYLFPELTSTALSKGLCFLWSDTETSASRAVNPFSNLPVAARDGVDPSRRARATPVWAPKGIYTVLRLYLVIITWSAQSLTGRHKSFRLHWIRRHCCTHSFVRCNINFTSCDFIWIMYSTISNDSYPLNYYLYTTCVFVFSHPNE